MASLPRIMALDVATRTGVCIGRPGEKPFITSVTFGSESDSKDLVGAIRKGARAAEWLLGFLKVNPVDRIVMEAPVPEQALGHATNAQSTVVKLMLIGGLGIVADLKSIRLDPANIQRVRKGFIGRGNLKGDIAKPRVMLVSKALGWEPKNSDEGDAAAVWWWACREVAPQITPPVEPIILGIPPVDPDGKPERKPRAASPEKPSPVFRKPGGR